MPRNGAPHPRDLIGQLIEAMQCMPGIGPRSAQRIVFQLLSRDRDGGRKLAQILLATMDGVGHCRSCRTFSEAHECAICASDKRDAALLCVVENPPDVLAIDQASHYRGKYFVLLGRLSPLDGIKPQDLGLEQLASRLESGAIREVIVATGATMEGEATAHYISEIAHRAQVKVSRIAHGVPLGGDLDHVDGSTLSHAVTSRREI